MNNETLVQSVRDLCKNNNISVSQLESDLNFGAGLISRWSKSSPSVDKIIDIADYFKISLDEVVGRNQDIDDEFLSTLFNSTEKGLIKWLLPNEITDYPVNLISNKILDDGIYEEIQYCARYKDSCIIMYSYHKCGCVLNPDVLCLYIQTSTNGDISIQPYEKDELKLLWIKVLNSCNNPPSEIKAEDLKNSFINEFNQPKSKKKKNVFVGNPHNHIQGDFLSKKSPIRPIFDETGCVLFDLKNKEILDQNEYTGITDVAKEFYYKNKDLLGKIEAAKLEKGKDLFLLSEDKVMKLSGFTWGKECGMHGFNGLLEVLNDANLEVNRHTNFDGDDFYLLPPVK